MGDIVMGILEPITHKEEIEELLSDAQTKYDLAVKLFEKQKAKTSKELELLGKVKIDSWAKEMENFSKNFKCFSNLEVIKKEEKEILFAGQNETPGQMLINIEQASIKAEDLIKEGGLAIGAGALVGVATLGGAVLFGKSSTGTAISELKGAAKKNALLSFFGGGSKSTGGFGIDGGKLVIAGVVIAPILLVSGIIAAAKGKTKLAEAKKVHAETMEKIETIKTVSIAMSGIERFAKNYKGFINNVNRMFNPFINEIERIKNEHSGSEEDKIDFNSLDKMEQKTIHLSWLMAQIEYNVLSATLLTDDGYVSKEAKETYKSANKAFGSVKKDIVKAENDGLKVGDVFWKTQSNIMIGVNILFCSVMILCMIITMKTSFLSGMKFLVAAIIAFPIFIVKKDLSKNKQFKWRIIRLVAAVLFILIMLVII